MPFVTAVMPLNLREVARTRARRPKCPNNTWGNLMRNDSLTPVPTIFVASDLVITARKV